MECDNAVLIIDEIKGRKLAEALDIKIIGTLGILLEAYNQGEITDALEVINDLKKVGFRVSESLIQYLRENL